MKDTLRERIMCDVVDTVSAVPAIAGATDDEPIGDNPYGEPTQPRKSEWGMPELPYAYCFELSESVEHNTTNAYGATLVVQIECAFNYGEDGSAGLKPLGRDILGDIQAAMLENPWRGYSPAGSESRNAFRTMELGNDIVEAPMEEGIGVVLIQYEIKYQRSFTDPTVKNC